MSGEIPAEHEPAMAMIIKVARDVALTAVDKLSRYSRHMGACTCPDTNLSVSLFTVAWLLQAPLLHHVELAVCGAHNSEDQGYTTQLGEIGCKGSGPFLSWSNVSLGFSKCICQVLVMLVLSAYQVLQNRRRHSAMSCIRLVSNNPEQHTLASTHRNNRQTARDVAGAVKRK